MSILQIVVFVLVVMAIYAFTGVAVGFARQNAYPPHEFSWRLAFRTIPVWPYVVIHRLVRSFSNPREFEEYEQ